MCLLLGHLFAFLRGFSVTDTGPITLPLRKRGVITVEYSIYGFAKGVLEDSFYLPIHHVKPPWLSGRLLYMLPAVWSVPRTSEVGGSC